MLARICGYAADPLACQYSICWNILFSCLRVFLVSCAFALLSCCPVVMLPCCVVVLFFFTYIKPSSCQWKNVISLWKTLQLYNSSCQWPALQFVKEHNATLQWMKHAVAPAPIVLSCRSCTDNTRQTVLCRQRPTMVLVQGRPRRQRPTPLLEAAAFSQ